MRSTQARSSSSERALASESIGCRWVTFSSLETGSPPTRCVGRIGGDAARGARARSSAARRAARRRRRRRSRDRRGRSSGGRGGPVAPGAPRRARSAQSSSRPRLEQRRQVEARSASMPCSAVRSKCSGVTAIRPVGDRGRSVPGSSLGRARPRRPGRASRAGVLLDQVEVVLVDPLAQPRDLDALDRPAGHVDVQQRARPAAARRRAGRPPARRTPRRASKSNCCRAGSPRRAPRDCCETAIAGMPSTTPSSAAATVPE